MSENKKSYVEIQIEHIQHNAKENTLVNGVPKDLTYQQAMSIYLRSKQLIKENNRDTNLNSKELSRQINVCYRQRQERNNIY